MIRKLPDAPFISFKFLDEEEGCSLRAHSHPELSVGLVTTSGTDVTVEGLDFSMKSGDLILIPAEQIHLCRPENEETFRFYMIFMDAGWVEETTGIPGRLVRPAAGPCPPRWRELFRLLEETPENPGILPRLTEAIRELVAAAGRKHPAGSIEAADHPVAGDPLENVHRRIAASPQFSPAY